MEVPMSEFWTTHMPEEIDPEGIIEGIVDGIVEHNVKKAAGDILRDIAIMHDEPGKFTVFFWDDWIKGEVEILGDLIEEPGGCPLYGTQKMEKYAEFYESEARKIREWMAAHGEKNMDDES
jgi:hypothetical protein